MKILDDSLAVAKLIIQYRASYKMFHNQSQVVYRSKIDI